MTPEIMRLLKDNKQLLLAHLKQRQQATEADGPVALPRSGDAPLSPAQQRLWVIDRLESGSAHYNTPGALRVTGHFDVAAAENAYRRIIQRHETLRTVFVSGPDGPLQHVRETFDFGIACEDLSALDAPTAQARIDAAIAADAARPFDLANDVMLRVSYLRTAAEQGVLLFNMPHIASDGWSIAVLVDEFVQLYRAALTHEDIELPPLPLQYADYAIWQRQQMNSDGLRAQLEYWAAQLADLPLLHGVPLDYPRPAQATHGGARIGVSLDAETSAQLQRLALTHKCTLFMVVHAAFALLLARHSGRSDGVIGTAVANRRHATLERLIGFFVNTLVLRTECDQSRPFSEFLQQVRRVNLQAQSNQDVPFEQLLERLNTPRSQRHNPLFQIMLSMDNNSGYAVDLPGVRMHSIDNEAPHAKFDLDVSVLQNDAQIALEFVYNTDLFSAERVQGLASGLQRLLGCIATDPDRRMVDLPILDDEAINAHWRAMNPQGLPDTACSAPESLHQALSSRAQSHADALALLGTDGPVDWRALDRRSNRLARWLQQQCPTQAEETACIGLQLSAHSAAAVAAWAVLKAGFVLRPMRADETADANADWPRLDLLLTTEPGVPNGENPRAHALTEIEERAQNLDESALPQPPQGMAAALLRSTDDAPAMVYSRQALTRRLQRLAQRLRLGQKPLCVALNAVDPQTWLQLTLAAALVDGGAVYFIEDALDSDAVQSLLQNHGVGLLCLKPGPLRKALPAWTFSAPVHVDVALCGHDALCVGLFEAWRRSPLGEGAMLQLQSWPNDPLITHVLEMDAAQTPTCVGAALPGRSLWLCDAHAQTLPVGAVGELLLRCDDAPLRGWHNGEWHALPAVAVNWPSEHAGECLHSGALGQTLANGDVRRLGQSAALFQRHGQPVIGAWLEALLTSETDIDACAAWPNAARSAVHLHFSVVNNATGCDLDALKARILAEWPVSHVPLHVQQRDDWPLTSTGDIDRDALAKAAIHETADEAPAPNLRATEQALQQIWADLLNVPVNEVDPKADFFALGGDSILSIQAVARARDAGLAFTVNQLFEQQSIRALAPLVGCQDTAQTQDEISGAAPLLPIQRRFFAQSVDPHHFNQAVMVHIPADLDADALRRCTEALLRRHAALRLRFQQDAAGNWQAHHANIDEAMLDDIMAHIQCDGVDFAGLAEQATALHASLDLANGPMLRVAHVRDATGGHALLISVHHLLIDGVSWRILLDDLQRMHRRMQRGESLHWPNPSASYQAWGQWLNSAEAAKRCLAQRAHWHAAEVPAGELQTQGGGQGWGHVHCALDARQTQSLLIDAQAAHRTRINELLLAALWLAVHRLTGQRQIRIEMESHGREAMHSGLDLSQTVGWFTALYPLLLHSSSAEPAALIEAIKSAHRAVPDLGVGHGVLKHLHGDEALAHNAPADVLFNYLGQFNQTGQGGDGFAPCNAEIGALVSPRRIAENPVNLNGAVDGGCLRFNLDYARQRLSDAEAERLLEHFHAALLDITAHCLSSEESAAQADDFPLARIDAESLRQWQRRYDIEDLYPATAMQQGMLYHSARAAEAYVTQMVFTLNSLDVQAFRRAWQHAIDRHAVLRTVFVTGEDGEVRQLVTRNATLPWQTDDLSGLTKAQQDACTEAHRRADKRRGFDPAQAPLLRVHLWQLGADRQRVLISSHHALLDGWSMPRLFAEVQQAYRAFAQQQTPDLPAPTPYRNYIEWLTTQQQHGADQHWREALTGWCGPCRIGEAEAGLLQASDASHVHHHFSLNDALSAALLTNARRLGVTLNAFLQAAWALILQRHCRQNPVCFGTTVSGRPTELNGVEHMIGLFINTVPVCLEVPLSQPFNAWIRAVQAAQLHRLQHSHTPLVEIQRCAPQAQGQPLFDSLLVFENYPHIGAGDDAIQVQDHSGHEESNYPLTLIVQHQDAVQLTLSGVTGRFDAAALQRLAAQLQSVFAAMATADDDPLASLPVVPQTELQWIGQMLSGRPVSTDHSAGMHRRLAAVAAQQPEAIALREDDAELTYAQLQQRASALAQHLQQRGVQAGDVVALCLPRGALNTVAMLAVLNCGAAYLPMDPHLPASRRAFMCQDSGAVLTLGAGQAPPQWPQENTWLALQPGLLDAADGAAELPCVDTDPNDIAYVIYTSGSTGQPKGVRVTHANLANLCSWHRRAYRVDHHSRASHLAGVGFDAAVWEIWPTLLAGGCLITVADHTRLHEAELLSLLSSSRVTHCFLPTALFESLYASLQTRKDLSIRWLLTGGEKLSALRWTRQDMQLVNHYGPTECTVVATAHAVQGDEVGDPPIGRAIDGAILHVLDEALQPVPLGGVGELCIGGAQVAAGYLHRDEMTRERFVPDRLAADANARMYRSGDLVRLRSDGALLFVGRADGQIKLRGHRIEPGEIEAAIRRVEGIESVAVVLQSAAGKSPQLVAYFTAEPGQSESGVIEHIKQRLRRDLPEYMMPAALQWLDALPLTVNGKVDRKALAERAVDVHNAAVAGPENACEATLQNIWAELLGVHAQDLDVTAHFFEIGGHSLLLTRMLHAIGKRLNHNLPIERALSDCSIRGIAQAIQGDAGTSAGTIQAAQNEVSEAPLSHAQYRVWFMEQLREHSNEHNMCTAVRVRGAFNPERLQQALQLLMQRHSVLRTGVVMRGEAPVQTIAATLNAPIDVHDLRALPAERRRQAADTLGKEHDTRVFDLSRPPLFSLRVLRLDEGEFLLHFNHHHIISDGWSQQLFYRQLLALYRRLGAGEACTNDPLPLQYTDYSRWQGEFLASDRAQAQAEFWRDYLRGASTEFDLPMARLNRSLSAPRKHAQGLIPVELRDRLKTLAQPHRGSLFNALHTGFAALLARLSGVDDFNLGMPVTGRHVPGSEDMLGVFLNLLPVRHRLDLNVGFTACLRAQIDNVNGVLSNQDLPFEQILELTGIERHSERTPLFQILFNMLSLPGGDWQAMADGFEIEALETADIENKFDLTLYLSDGADGVQVHCHFNSLRFSETAVQCLLSHYVRLLQCVCDEPEAPLLSHALNDSSIAAPIAQHGPNVIARLRRHSQLTPTATAVLDDGCVWSYAQLQSAINAVSGQLQAQGIGPGDAVGIMAARRSSLVIALCAVLQTGAHYFIATRELPWARLQRMLDRVQPAAMLLCADSEALVETLAHRLKQRLHCLEIDNAPEAFPSDVEFIAHVPAPLDPACITFTSGSTGESKAVVGCHAGLSDHLDWWPAAFEITAEDRFSLMSGLMHDPLQRDIFGALCNGATLVIPDAETVRDHRLAEWVRAQSISVMHLTPAMADILALSEARDLHSLRRLFLTGEALRSELARRLQDIGERLQLVHCYGATESQRALTYQRIAQPAARSGQVPMALHSPDTVLRVLNAAGVECAVGEVGEIHIESACLALGYLDDDVATEARFCTIGQGVRRYRSGDFAYPLDAETLHFIGRRDGQVNVRGHRVELGEIEHHLRGLTGLQACAAVLLDAGALAVFAVPAAGVDADALMAALQERAAQQLPAHQCPDVWQCLEALPLNANGKLDRLKLAALRPSEPEATLLPPQTDTEQKLAALWAEMLECAPQEIGRDSGFFALGGHSLLLIRLRHRLRRELGVALPIKTAFSHNRLRDMAEHIDALARSGANGEDRPPIQPRTNSEAEAPLSYAQQRLWFIDRLQGGSPQYNMAVALDVHGEFNADAAQAALCAVIQRHESLRSTYRDGEAGTELRIRPHVPFQLQRIDFSGLDATTQQLRIDQAARADAQLAFDLSKDVPLRVTQLHCSDAHSVLLFNMHHIASDGWSIGVLVREFSLAYAAQLRGQDADLPDLPLQYPDYAQWQRDWLRGAVLERQLHFWQHGLGDAPSVHGVPLDFERPKVQQFDGDSVKFTLSAEALSALRALAAQQHVTLFMVVHAAFAAFLGRQSNGEDVVIGTPIANRLDERLAPLIGYFANTLVLRSRAEQGGQFVQFLRHIRDVNLDAQQHQDVPFEFLVDRLRPARSLAHNPLCQIMLSMNTTESVELTLPGARVSARPATHTLAKFDLVLNANAVQRAGEDVLACELIYATALFTRARIERMAAGLEVLLTALPDASEKPLAELPMLGEDEQRWLLHKVNRTKHDTHAMPVHWLYEQTAARCAERTAVVHNDLSCSHAELNRQANRLARALQSMLPAESLQTGQVVGVCMHRSPALLQAQLALFKCGAAFLPLDPNQPEQRIRGMLEDSGAQAVLACRDTAHLLQGSDLACVVTDDFALSQQWQHFSADDLPHDGQSADDLAYVIYTSGSTGQPKGVRVHHAALLNLCRWHIREFCVNQDSIASWIASIGFDASVWEVWPNLLAGAQLHPISDALRRSPDELIEHLQRERVSHVYLPTALLHAGYENLQNCAELPLRFLFTGGDKLTRSDAIGPATRLFNLYGPSETTVTSTWAEVLPEHGAAPPIGAPVDNTRVYLLNRDGALTPQGCAGELHIAGAGLSKGYLKRPELTAERFVDARLTDQLSERVYRTGDLVRWRDDALLQFLGREDHQVKIRGFRIELGEIQHHINALPDVHNAVVLADAGANGHKQLKAYLVPRHAATAPSLDEIKQRLHDVLPDYMVPQHMHWVPHLPTNANGKIDAAALAALATAQSPSAAVQPPPAAGTQAQHLIEVLAEVLQRPAEDIDLDCGFFDLGGHSLAILSVIRKLDARGISCRVQDFYSATSLRSLCTADDSPGESTAGFVHALNDSDAPVQLCLVHPMGGRIDGFRPLAQALSGAVAVCGIEAPFIGGSALEFSSWQALAAHYVNALQARQPHGPYKLGGWSIGGLIALHMAEELQRRGETVDYLVAFDSFVSPQDRSPQDFAEALDAVLKHTHSGVANSWNAAPEAGHSASEETLLNRATDALIATGHEHGGRQLLLEELRFGVHLFSATGAAPTLQIDGRTRVFIAAHNRAPEQLLAGWQAAVHSPMQHTQVSGGHHDLLQGAALAAIVVQLQSDLLDNTQSQ